MGLGLECFFNRPIEIIEHIISAVDEPRDLLALTLSTKGLYGLIVTYALQLCRIRCGPAQQRVWGILAVQTHLAVIMRALNLIHTIPSCCAISPQQLSTTLGLYRDKTLLNNRIQSS